MPENSEREKCNITSTVKILCPYCGAVVEIPMQQAVNGQIIFCGQCKRNFQFGG